MKWAKLCHTLQGRAVALNYGLKEHCALGFMKGVLLRDAKGMLTKPGGNSQSLRWIKFSAVEEIAAMGPILRAYIHEATEVKRAGLEVDFKEKRELVLRNLAPRGLLVLAKSLHELRQFGGIVGWTSNLP